MWTVLMLLACTPKAPPSSAVMEVVAAPEPTPTPVDVVLRDDDIVVVAVESPRSRVLQFSDWQCPHCSVASPKMLAAVKELGDVELRFRTFPLSSGCAPMAMSLDLPERCELARLALCARDAGRFEEFLAVGFEGAPYAYTLPEWSTPELVACREAPATQELVLAHAQTGVDLGLMGTPTFYVQVGEQWFEADGLDVALRQIAR